MPVTSPEVWERHRQRYLETREEYASRSGVDPDEIDVELWNQCVLWREGRTECNCAFALCGTADIPLPDHACGEATGRSVEWYLARHRRSCAGIYADGWQHVVDVPEDASVFCIVERTIPGGSATLFGVLEDSHGRVQPFVAECVIQTHGDGADLERKLRSWYDGLFRRHSVGRPRGTRWGRAELRADFEQALKEMKRERKRITVGAVAREMAVSRSTLNRAMRDGAIRRRKEWA